ncbi:MAG: hypothetical protein A2452_04725 [Candidatus Firestonebacteria bacterium RIFOXYC2_FULL_39_67]|nr:MAG: hypothetical protein A2536_11695 [Candidatus Firestonebacteria bacterium RIFOXYD2_FULL_39_29]OGF55007.1 MAG: hypothetical protein A2497_03865 [Candidatus Firestonebacteria bacterium RifOxyC12_full_39_7]OGF55890.1 MAG: hypothetical protein A2452_04725 [Candidatus Firestonebacteria bacterium RIFOXYC2_FULL_39_67]
MSTRKERKYLIDTDVLINQLKAGSNKLSAVVNETEYIYISVINEYELFRGIHNENQIAALEKSLSFFGRIQISSEIAKKAADYARDKNIINSLGLADILIAATCNIHGLVLVTENIKHFRMIPDIIIY